MRKHVGMRPQDIVILLKIISAKKSYLNKDLASELFISPSEISDSLNRSAISGLVNHDKKKVNKISLLEFIEYGLPYVFPAIPQGLSNGLPTAHSHPDIRQEFIFDENFVWPDHRGQSRGYIVEPLHKEVVKAASLDSKLYKMLALTDMIRIGKVREVKYAVDELKRIIHAE